MADSNSSISKVNVCPKCNADVEPGLKFCTSCGSKVVDPVSGGEGIICSNCFADVEPGLKFCTSCGSKVEVVVSGGEGTICSNCFADVEPGLKFCTSCGTKTESIVSETVCPTCYVDVQPSLKFCTECGTSMIQSEKLTSNQISQKLREKREKEGKINPQEDEIFESIKETGNGLMKGLNGFMSKATGELDKVLNQPPTKSSKRRRMPDINPGYLVCDTCDGYYELQKGEKPDDFMDECECGGKYIHKMRL
ncbi:MAG: zinc ribbon domain-containing protein [Methanobacterium sp.]|nr:zinc ribbon domain-containing protein [Methanobacterium sp.]MBV1754642.1 zinc ribbon domain-containing protein [Methanobacterium sp.]